MKSQPVKRLVPSLIALAFLVPSAGSGAGNVLEMQSLLEGRLRPIVRELDPKALVYVTVRTKSIEAELPATPFIYRDYILEGPEGEMLVDRIDVRIFSDVKEFPPALKKVIRELSGIFAPMTRVTVKPLPEEFGKFAETLKQERNVANQDSAVTAEAPQRGTPSRGAFFAQWLASAVTALERVGWHIPALLALLSGIAFALLLLRAIRHGTTMIHQSLDTGFERFARSLERAAVQASEHASSSAAFATTNAPETWDGLSEEAWLALLTDCYWTEEDRYAAFLWKRMPFAHRKRALAEFPFLEAYVGYLGLVSENDLGLDTDPYYLNPLAIGALDNEAVAALTRECPALLARLSPLRVAALPLSPDERLALLRAAEENPGATPNLRAFPPSLPRRLPRAVPMSDVAPQDEDRFLGERAASVETVAAIPSLGWLLHLPESQARALLAEHSADQLATAWVGPHAVLTKLEDLLPQTRARQLAERLRTVRPSRKSPTFRRLHQQIVDAYRKRASHLRSTEATAA